MITIHIYVDGGCLRNGQPDAEAYGSVLIIAFEGEHEIKRRKYTGSYPELNTSNQAEIMTLIMALREMQSTDTAILVRTDSQNLVGWLCLNWKRKDATLREMLAEVDNEISRFPNLRIEKVSREEIVKWLGH